MRHFLMAMALIAPMAYVAQDAQAQSAEEKVVEARRAYFKLMGANMGPLGAMAKGNIEYNAETAQLHAGNLAAIASYNPTPHFAAGTSNADMPGKTRLLPAAFSDTPGLLSKLKDFQTAVAALQDAAGGGREALGPAVGKVGGTCKGCHDDFRAKDF
jgi:cytochrome c556